jgi:hypothetical protein
MKEINQYLTGKATTGQKLKKLKVLLFTGSLTRWLVQVMSSNGGKAKPMVLLLMM